MGKAIEVEGLTKTYGDVTAVDDISFTVEEGAVFAFLGPNGAGKTTTVEIIEMIRTADAGTIRVLGSDITRQPAAIKENIGVLPQEFQSFERLTVRETITYFAKLYRRHADIDRIIDLMDLRDKEHDLYRNLSGGLKQRVGVGIALVNDPDIVFLDEPTTGLDPKARRDVWNAIAGLREEGKTVFLTTHYMEEAEYLADHIAIIHQGRIVAEGSLDDLIQQYRGKSVLSI
ncbi:MAG: ABC transporter ATP-binding protein, partial [Thermoplasmatota archaeon]